MKIIITITYKDDNKEVFECCDYPYFGDFLIVYTTPVARIYIPKDSILRVEAKIK